MGGLCGQAPQKKVVEKKKMLLSLEMRDGIFMTGWFLSIASMEHIQ